MNWSISAACLSGAGSLEEAVPMNTSSQGDIPARHKKRTAAVQAEVLYDLIQSELCFGRLLLTGFYGDALLLHFLFCNQILNCFFGAHQFFHGHGFII